MGDSRTPERDRDAGRTPWIEPIFPNARIPAAQLADLRHFGLDAALLFSGPQRRPATTQGWLDAQARSRKAGEAQLACHGLTPSSGVRFSATQLPARWHGDLFRRAIADEPLPRVLAELDTSGDVAWLEALLDAMGGQDGLLLLQVPGQDPLPALSAVWSLVEPVLPAERVVVVGVDWRTARWTGERGLAGVLRVGAGASHLTGAVELLTGIGERWRSRLMLSGATPGGVDVLAVPRCAERLLAAGREPSEVALWCGGTARRLLAL